MNHSNPIITKITVYEATGKQFSRPNLGGIYQKKSGQPFQHVGSLHAFDKEMALDNARDLYTRRDKPSGRVVPAREIVAVSPGDAAPFFDP